VQDQAIATTMRATFILAAVASARTAALHLSLPKRPTLGRRAAKSGTAEKSMEGLNKEFFAIALPAVVQFAAEPFARLVDTAYMGRLGATALGGAGAAVSAQYALGKLSNDPLLRTSISLVAAEGETGDNSAAVAAALCLALFVGALQGLTVLLAAPRLLQAFGVAASSPMQSHALWYLRIAALGAPTATVWLVANGVFRGLGDTATPLKWALAFTALNAVLDPLFIFPLRLGAAGAAAGTALSQTLALYPLLRALAKRTGAGSVANLLRCERSALTAQLANYGKAGGLVLVRTLGKISAYSVCAREAAKLGAVSSAAHAVCFALGVATTQLCEAAAVATQTLLAREFYAEHTQDTKRSKHILQLGMATGLGCSSLLALCTHLNRFNVVNGLTTDLRVRAACLGVFPLVMLCQALKGLAYPVNGALMGALDWSAASVTMWASNIACLMVLARPAPASLAKLWQGFAALFVVQCTAGLLRVGSRTGPWRRLRSSSA
jgi:putative MATE family efflux protein